MTEAELAEGMSSDLSAQDTDISRQFPALSLNYPANYPGSMGQEIATGEARP